EGDADTSERAHGPRVDSWVHAWGRPSDPAAVTRGAGPLGPASIARDVDLARPERVASRCCRDRGIETIDPWIDVAARSRSRSWSGWAAAQVRRPSPLRWPSAIPPLRPP